MDLVIVAFYTLCDDLLIEHGYQDDSTRQNVCRRSDDHCVSRSRTVSWQSTDGPVLPQRTRIYSQYAE